MTGSKLPIIYRRLLCFAGSTLLILTFLTTIFHRPVLAENSALPFQQGEHLRYNLFWGFIRVGEAVMVVLPNTFAAGKEVRRFSLKIRTTALIDLIYKVRSEFEALSNMELSRSMGYRKIQSEAGTHKDETVHFNWQNLTAGHVNNGRYTAVTPIQPGTFDPLGIFYFLRTVNLTDIDHFERPVTDGKKCIVSRLVVTGKDRIRWGDSFHDTYAIRSHMKGIEGLFEKSQDSNYTLWLSADAKRIPLVIEIDMFFGTIVCSLVPPSSG